MTTEYSITIDWHEEFKGNPDKWINHGRRVAEESFTHTTQYKEETNIFYSGGCEECDFYEGSAEPIMNYGYFLYALPSDEKIKDIIDKTCLTVMENQDTGDCFLVLCGGGVDLSQDVGLAYLLAGQRIPDALAFNISTQYGLSESGEEGFKVMKGIEESLSSSISAYGGKLENVKEALDKAKGKLKSIISEDKT